MNRLRTPLGEQLYEAFKEPLRQFLREVDARIGTDDFGPVETLHATLELEKKKNDSSPDAVHDDLFTLGAYVCFFEAYGRLWRLIPRRPPKLPHPWPPKLLHLAGVN